MNQRKHKVGFSEAMRSPLWLFYFACSSVLFISLIIFTHQVDASTNIVKDTSILLTESMLLMSPAIFAGKRWRWIVCVIAALCNLFMLANLDYSRYWQDLIPFSSIFNKSSYNALVLKSSVTYLRLSDIIFIVNGIIPLILYKVLDISQKDGLTIITRTLTVAFITALYLIAQALSVNSIKSYYRSIGTADFTFHDAVKSRQIMQSNRKCMWRGTGLILYTAYQMSHISDSKSISLTDKEVEKIDNFLNTNRNSYIEQFEFNRDKNLILIIVESLNADVIEKTINGIEITPVLNRLINEEGTVSNLNVITQVKDGGSSDGQMIYNTGLLPIKSGCTAYNFGSNEFPSLVKVLKPAKSIEIISEQGFVWNHFETSKQYGYNHLFERIGEGDGVSEHPGADALLFRKALQLSKDLEQPFLMEITTFSMHSPFLDPYATTDKSLENLNDISMQLAHYYRMTNYFDTQLGYFINGLKDNGLYDKSVIVIVSDHNVDISGNGDDYKNIVFMAVNSGKNERINRTVGQIDVFPTVLDIMGADDETWRGLGISMFDNDNTSAFDAYGNRHGNSSDSIEKHQREAWDISDLIIRSNYFSDK